MTARPPRRRRIKPQRMLWKLQSLTNLINLILKKKRKRKRNQSQSLKRRRRRTWLSAKRNPKKEEKKEEKKEDKKEEKKAEANEEKEKSDAKKRHQLKKKYKGIKLSKEQMEALEADAGL